MSVTSVMINGETETFFELRAEMACRAVEKDFANRTEGNPSALELAARPRIALNSGHEYDHENGPLAAIDAAVDYFLNTANEGVDDSHGIGKVASIIGADRWEYAVQQWEARLFTAYTEERGRMMKHGPIDDARRRLTAAYEDMWVAKEASWEVFFPMWDRPGVEDLTDEDFSCLLRGRLAEHGITSRAQVDALAQHEILALDKALNLKGGFIYKMARRQKLA